MTTTSSVISLKEELKSIYKATRDEIKYLIDDGLAVYEVNQKEKFEKLNTFLYRHDPVSFYDIYFPLNLKGKKPSNEEYIVEVNDKPKNIFKHSRCVTIIGDAGSGKSMLMKHFFLHFLKYELEIPIFIELRNLNSFNGSFFEYIVQIIYNNRLSPNIKILERILTDGKFLFILDGYDELHSKNILRRKDEILQFIEKYRANYFIISSRRGTYIESLPRFHNLYIAALHVSSISHFIDKQLKVIDDNTDILQKKLTDVLSDPKNEDYMDYMKNPLLLTMFIFTFRNHPEIPHTKNRFYYNVFETLCTRHDNFSKNADIHERRTKLKTEEFEDILQWFSYKSFFDEAWTFSHQYLFTSLNDIKKRRNLKVDIDELIYDLSVSIAIMLIEGIDYKFPHRSLQEYFLALLISRQSIDNRNMIYKKLLNLNSSLDNLFVLCKELDPIVLSRFSLARLKNLYNKIYDEKQKKRNLKYLKLVGYCFVNTNIVEDGCLNLNGFNGKLEKDYKNLPVNVLMINHLRKIKLPQKWLDFFEEDRYDFKAVAEEGILELVNENLDSCFYELLLDLGLSNFVNNLLDDISKEINRIESFIKTEELQNEDLLDLV